tara:strand:- start:161 stop:607 length:447 start_codon:yes stop_codon:yes gene_type:complete
MTQTYKTFNARLHAENDGKGKTFASKILKSMYPDCKIVEGDKYGVDLKIIKDDQIIKKAEVEVRHNWKGDFDFPFSTVNIPSRKKKFFDGNCLYFSINKNLTRCMMIDDKDILESPLEENPNRFVSSNEMFYKVSTSKCKSLQIKDYQ